MKSRSYKCISELIQAPLNFADSKMLLSIVFKPVILITQTRTHKHTQTRIHTHTCTHTHTYTCTHTNTHTHPHVHTNTHTHAQTHTQPVKSMHVLFKHTFCWYTLSVVFYFVRHLFIRASKNNYVWSSVILCSDIGCHIKYTVLNIHLKIIHLKKFSAFLIINENFYSNKR